MATEGKSPINVFFEISPTDLEKFGRDDQVTLLAHKRQPPAPPRKKATKTRTKKPRKKT